MPQVIISEQLLPQEFSCAATVKNQTTWTNRQLFVTVCRQVLQTAELDCVKWCIACIQLIRVESAVPPLNFHRVSLHLRQGFVCHWKSVGGFPRCLNSGCRQRNKYVYFMYSSVVFGFHCSRWTPPVFHVFSQIPSVLSGFNSCSHKNLSAVLWILSGSCHRLFTTSFSPYLFLSLQHWYVCAYGCHVRACVCACVRACVRAFRGPFVVITLLLVRV